MQTPKPVFSPWSSKFCYKSPFLWAIMLYSQVHLNMTMVAKNYLEKIFGYSKPTNNLKGTEFFKIIFYDSKSLVFRSLQIKLRQRSSNQCFKNLKN